ncbi:MAG: mechanosensitive ion channel domain-containing protein [Marinicellaceae bacterium]
MHKYSFLNRFFPIVLFLLSSIAYSQTDLIPQKKVLVFPVIVEHIDKSLFEGESKQIKEQIEKRKVTLNKFITQLEQDLEEQLLQEQNTRQLIESDDSQENLEPITNNVLEEKLSEIINNQSEIRDIIGSIKDVNYKHITLIQELENKTETNISIEITQPYTIESVVKLNDFIEKISEQIQSKQDLIDKNAQRFEKLKSVLKDLVTQYSVQINDKKESKSIYTSIRNIYLYQADYALLNLKNRKLEETLKILSDELNSKQELFPTVIENIQITKGMLDDLDKQRVELTQQYNELKEEHIKLNKDFDKISFKAELEFDNLEAKIINAEDQATVDVLQLQKQNKLAKIEYSYFIKNLLQQEELSARLNVEEVEFKFSWLKAFNQRKSNQQDFKDLIKNWQNKITELTVVQDDNTQLLESLNRSIFEIGRQQTQVQDNENTDKAFLKHKKSLIKQLDKNLETTQRLSLVLNENLEKITQMSSKNTRIIGVLSQQLNKLEQIGQWFDDKFTNQLQNAEKVLYYPIASFGDKPFTILSALKVILYLILGFLILKYFRKWFTNFLTKRTRLSEGASHSISTLIYYFGVFLVFLSALSAAGFNLSQMIIVFGALGVGIGFGLQNIANNFISGMILLIDRTLTVGDSISLSDGTNGKVAKLAMRYTVIRTNGGFDIIVPNSELIANRVTSLTFDDNYLRLEIPFGVSYDSDPEQVRELTLEVVNNVKHTINRESQTSAVLFKGFGDNSLDFVLRVWVFIYDRYRPYAIKSDYYYKLFKAFKEAGIEIPYPQRDLHIRGVDKQTIEAFQDKDRSTTRVDNSSD